MDEPLARTAAFDEKLVPIDTELGNLLEAFDRLIHRRIEEFLTEILSSAKEKRKRVVISLPVRGNIQPKVGDGIITTTEQEANNDGKSPTSAMLLRSEASCRLMEKSAYSVLSKLSAPVRNPLHYQLTATPVTSKFFFGSSTITIQY